MGLYRIKTDEELTIQFGDWRNEYNFFYIQALDQYLGQVVEMDKPVVHKSGEKNIRYRRLSGGVLAFVEDMFEECVELEF